MKSLKEFVDTNKIHKLFKDYCDKFDITTIPLKDRQKIMDLAKIEKIYNELSEDGLLELDDNVIYENVSKKTESIKTVINNLKEKYKLENYNFEVYDPFGVNIVKVDNIPNYLQSTNAILIQFTKSNIQTIENEMKKNGYYKVFDKIYKDPDTNIKWVRIIFDPINQESISQQIRDYYTYIYHCSPIKNKQSIKQNGITPNNEGRLYTYNENRVYLIIVDPKSENFVSMMKKITINRKKHDKKFNGKYNIYTISVNKIPNNIEFYQDPHGKDCIYVKEIIPYNCIINVNEKTY